MVGWGKDEAEYKYAGEQEAKVVIDSLDDFLSFFQTNQSVCPLFAWSQTLLLQSQQRV
jgi:hypothetical protein